MPVPVISIAQMREWEKATWTSGESEAEVIRRVGRAVAEYALRITKTGDFILVLSGTGNNGADSRATLEHFDERNVDTIEVRDPESDFAELESLLRLRPALIIDGLFGIGINRPLEPAWIKFIQRINAAQLRILSVDVPSGLNADAGEPQGAAIEAAVTMTVGAPKSGLLKQAAWPFVGRMEITPDVGLVPCPVTNDINWTTPSDFAGFPPARSVAGHKGTFGHLAILAGSAGHHGAAVLAARGAQRARPGLITLFTEESTYLPVATQLQSVMVEAWNENSELSGEFSTVLAGPGLVRPRQPEEMHQMVRRLWRNSSAPVIVDASALDWLQEGPVPENALRVITPHPGEAARLLKSKPDEIQANRTHSLRELSRRFGNCWVVLKGHQTIVGRQEGDIFINCSGNSGLAQGGSGDVLAGYLAGLLARPTLQTDALRTIRYAVWQHGVAADHLESARPNWVIEELLEALGMPF